MPYETFGWCPEHCCVFGTDYGLRAQRNGDTFIRPMFEHIRLDVDEEDWADAASWPEPQNKSAIRRIRDTQGLEID